MQIELAPFLHVICLQEIEPSPMSDEDTRAGPRRALKVTCAIQFSKSVIKASPEWKRRARNLAFSLLEVKDFLVGFIPCSKGNIWPRSLAVNPPEL